MKMFLAFSKKELLEQIKTYKVLILFSIFFAIGILSPLTAKLLPQIFKIVGISDIQISLPTPTFIDSYTQLFKNITQVGFIIILLMLNGNISNEISKGTLINLLSKGLSKNIVIFSKLFISIIIWTLSLLISTITTYIYTLFLFENHSIKGLILSCFCVWLFGILIITLILFSSILIHPYYGGLLLSLSLLSILFLLNLIPKIKEFNPVYLVTNNIKIIENPSLINLTGTCLITLFLIIIFISSSLLIFNKKQL